MYIIYCRERLITTTQALVYKPYPASDWRRKNRNFTVAKPVMAKEAEKAKEA
jgi:hypothetical protein